MSKSFYKMYISPVGRSIRRKLLPVKKLFFGSFDDYLKSCKGIIHVGAHSGGERDHYDKLGLKVLWIEPILDVYRQLEKNIARYPNQRSVHALVSDEEGVDLVLNIASNSGGSSSIFELGGHKRMWPEVNYIDKITMKSETLASIITKNGIELSDYDGLVLDTQGAELLILKGASSILSSFKFIQAEAADFESYENGATAEEIKSYLLSQGFKIYSQKIAAKRKNVGRYYELLFKAK